MSFIPVEEQIVTILTPVFGDEIYPIIHPDPDGNQGSVSDVYATYSHVGGYTASSLEGSSGLGRYRIQISIYAMDYTEMKTKQSAVISAMAAANLLASQALDAHQDALTIDGAMANIITDTFIEGFEQDTRRFSTFIDYYCWGII